MRFKQHFKHAFSKVVGDFMYTRVHEHVRPCGHSQGAAAARGSEFEGPNEVPASRMHELSSNSFQGAAVALSLAFRAFHVQVFGQARFT